LLGPSLEEYRSLNYNDKPGVSEDEAKDPQWRDKKYGLNTVLGTRPSQTPAQPAANPQPSTKPRFFQRKKDETMKAAGKAGGKVMETFQKAPEVISNVRKPVIGGLNRLRELTQRDQSQSR
jgi:hypothetical protein